MIPPESSPLSNFRGALKHNGTLPSRLDIEAYRDAATNFFAEACPLIFGITFEDISLIEYVSSDDIREHLKKAQAFSVGGDLSAATDEIAVAYEKLIEGYSVKKSIEHNKTYSSSPSVSILSVT